MLATLARCPSLARDRTFACGSLAAGHLRGPRGAQCRAALSRREQDAVRRLRDQTIRGLLEVALQELYREEGPRDGRP
jgi:hypothetical protein